MVKKNVTVAEQCSGVESNLLSTPSRYKPAYYRPETLLCARFLALAILISVSESYG
jgi:hypothetical protein